MKLEVLQMIGLSLAWVINPDLFELMDLILFINL